MSTFPPTWTELTLHDQENFVKLYHECDSIIMETHVIDTEENTYFYLSIDDAEELVDLLNYKINQMKKYSDE